MWSATVLNDKQMSETQITQKSYTDTVLQIFEKIMKIFEHFHYRRLLNLLYSTPRIHRMSADCEIYPIIPKSEGNFIVLYYSDRKIYPIYQSSTVVNSTNGILAF